MQFYRMSRYPPKKILSMTTSNYKLDTRYALVDTDIINNKKNIIYTEAMTFFHSISDVNHITQNTFISRITHVSATHVLHQYFKTCNTYVRYKPV